MIKKIVDVIKNNKSFLLTTHINPDGDAIGSELALGICLANMGKEVTIFNQDDTPAVYRFLPNVEKIIHQLNSTGDFDYVFLLDSADIERRGTDFNDILSEIRIINIDHHITNTYFGELNMVDKNASATGELIYRIIKEIPAEITLPIATNIYTAILTDTGSFHYSNVTAKSFEISGEMIELGVSPWKVAEAVYENRSSAKLRLLGLALNTLEMFEGGMIGAITVDQFMLGQTNATLDDTEDFVNYPRSIASVKVALLFKEVSEDCFKLSLRAKGEVNVAEIAGHFGGGGHKNAAGFMIRGKLSDIKKEILLFIKKKLVNCFH